MSCGTNEVCDSSERCVACTAGIACVPPSNPCVTGTISCSTSAGPICNPTGTPVSTGATNTTCIPSNPCHAGVGFCANGTLTCKDVSATTGQFGSAGMVCGIEQGVRRRRDVRL